MSEIKEFLRQIEMFLGLSERMVAEVAKLCRPESYEADHIIMERNSPPTHLYLIREGTVEINTATDTAATAEGVVVTLGKGQSFGEMGLVDNGTRSATVKAATPTDLLAIECAHLRRLCETDTDLGYLVMRNIASDLSFKLRNRNLI
ncbi:MAG: cyclic nucleotide-binding domain-containing protein [Anaerolineales bacterium]|nr:cyclic nucleotide-binding domain-containing protein [Anaerolineales bacterium]